MAFPIPDCAGLNSKFLVFLMEIDYLPYGRGTPGVGSGSGSLV